MDFFCVIAGVAVAIGVAGAEVSSKGGNSADPVNQPSRVAVFTAGQEGYHTFRIPTIVASSKGTLLAFCEGRRHNMYDFGDIDTVLKRFVF